MLTQRDARKDGRARGIAAASWRFDGNTTSATYRAFLAGLQDGDPAVLDAFAPPAWLSGEFAGESMVEVLGECHTARDEERQDAVATTYEDAAERAYWRELERVARLHVGDCVLAVAA